MTRSTVFTDVPAAPRPLLQFAPARGRPSWILQYAVALLAVGLAVGVGLGMRAAAPAASPALLFVLPVMSVAILYGWGPSLFAAVVGALAFDFFFTEPRYSLAIASPADLWSTGLLLLIGAIVSTLAAQVRRSALDARRAASQATALQDLAHAVISAEPRQRILDLAALALSRLFGAPAAILAPDGGGMTVLATAGDPKLSAIERSEAAVALDVRTPTHAGDYPTDRSRFDYWPVALPNGQAFVMGVDVSQAEFDRPAHAQRHVDAVGGYLAAAFR